MSKNGFTLIELLVVVLIIGILAAIAFPQYEKAVLKSRLTTVEPLVSSLSDANERFFLATGAYTANPDDLDVQIPTSFNSSFIAGCSLTLSGAYCNIKGNGSNLLQIARYYKNIQSNMANKFVCTALTTPDGQDACKTLTGKSSPDTGSHYFL